LKYRLRYLPEAEQDIKVAFDHLAPLAGTKTATKVVEAMLAACESLRDFPLRGAPRDHVRPGLRITSIKRSVTIAYAVIDQDVVILRILRRGRDLGKALADPTNEND
jgi:toxin ParE1/3/4